MKTFALLCVLTLMLPATARAELRTRMANSGQTTRMVVARSWNLDCDINGGVVKVTAKPQHGKLTNHLIETTVPLNRSGPNNSCLGRPTKGFEVDYTSERGFHGTDSFSLEVTTGLGRTFSDNYTVLVR